MKRFILISFSFVLLAFSPMQSGTVRIDFFRVGEMGNNLVVEWQTQVEEGVKEYELLRMTRFTNNQFVRVKSIPPHGTDKSYIYRDDQVFKSSGELVDYRLEVVYTDGAREQLASEQVNYTSTAIRRTWGSIKAMFQ